MGKLDKFKKCPNKSDLFTIDRTSVVTENKGKCAPGERGLSLKKTHGIYSKRTIGDDSIDSEDSSSDDSEDEASPGTSRQGVHSKSIKLASELKVDVDPSDIYVNVNAYDNPKKHTMQLDQLLSCRKDKDIMKKSVLTPDIESNYTLPTYEESVRKMKKERRADREKTKGKSWFNLPATELSDERKNDLMILKMRKALDPKRFYKNNDMKALPKYFQFGTVVEGPADFYSGRVPKKQRKRTIAEELLADADFKKYNKRKYAEIQQAKQQGSGPYKHMRRLKKKKKR